MIAWIAALLGWVGVSALPDQYESKAVINVDTTSIMKPLLRGLAVESDTDTGLNIMSRLLLSRENLEKVVRQTDLYLKANDSEAMSRLVEDLAGSINLHMRDRGRKTRDILYEISYQGTSPEIGYQVVSKLLNTLIETTLSAARTDTEEAQLFLDLQIAEYEKRLTTAEQRLAEFKRANLGLMPDETGGYYKKLQREQGKLEDLRSELQLAKRKLSEMHKQLDGELPLLGNNGYGRSQVLKLRKYRGQLENLLNQFTEEHPDVQALRATIARVVANESVEGDEFAEIGTGDSLEFNPVYQELRAEVGRASVEVATLKISLMEKEKSVEALKQSVDIIPDVEAKLAKLNRDYNITRERYLSMVERKESARLAQEVGLSGSNINFRIIDAPRVPLKPSGPDRIPLLAAVFFAAIASGLGWGFLRYLIQPTFINSSQIRDKIGLPMLGSVGLSLTAEHKRKRQMQLTSFLLVFILLVGSYGGAMVFSEPGSELVSGLISSGDR